MLWYILDKTRVPVVLVHADKKYLVQNVVQAYESIVNCDCSEDDEDTERYPRESSQVLHRSSSVSKRMIEQFLTQEDELD